MKIKYSTKVKHKNYNSVQMYKYTLYNVINNNSRCNF